VPCCKNKQYQAYDTAVELGKKNLEPHLDLVRFIRRIRMHGIGHHFVLGTSLRGLSARMAFSRPLQNIDMTEMKEIDPTDINQVSEKFAAIECLTKTDKFAIALFKRYGQVINKTLENKSKMNKAWTEKFNKMLHI
jgi:hypothetical protein